MYPLLDVSRGEESMIVWVESGTSKGSWFVSTYAE